MFLLAWSVINQLPSLHSLCEKKKKKKKKSSFKTEPVNPEALLSFVEKKKNKKQTDRSEFEIKIEWAKMSYIPNTTNNTNKKIQS